MDELGIVITNVARDFRDTREDMNALSISIEMNMQESEGKIDEKKPFLSQFGARSRVNQFERAFSKSPKSTRAGVFLPS